MITTVIFMVVFEGPLLSVRWVPGGYPRRHLQIVRAEDMLVLFGHRASCQGTFPNMVAHRDT